MAFRSALSVGLLLACQGCFYWPLRVAEPLDVVVVDAESGSPIPNASAIYFVCDIHDFQCRGAELVRIVADKRGTLKVDGRREWGPWIGAPGGMPAPNHFIAIWAPGYAAFVFGQYGGNVESMTVRYRRSDLLAALGSIPGDQSSSDSLLNPKRELKGGRIRLRKSSQ